MLQIANLLLLLGTTGAEIWSPVSLLGLSMALHLRDLYLFCFVIILGDQLISLLDQLTHILSNMSVGHSIWFYLYIYVYLMRAAKFDKTRLDIHKINDKILVFGPGAWSSNTTGRPLLFLSYNN